MCMTPLPVIIHVPERRFVIVDGKSRSCGECVVTPAKGAEKWIEHFDCKLELMWLNDVLRGCWAIRTHIEGCNLVMKSDLACF